jgi:uncharacterized repeat protein (TIGR01451 family)
MAVLLLGTAGSASAVVAPGPSFTNCRLTPVAPITVTGGVTTCAGASIDKMVSASGTAGTFVDAQTSGAALLVGAPATLYYKITLTNTGVVAFTNAVVTDPGCDATTLVKTGDAGTVGTLDVSETWVYTCTHVFVVGTDLNPFNNTATFSADSYKFSGETAQDPPHAVPAIADNSWAIVSALRVRKYGDSVRKAGSTIHYHMYVDNVGAVPLTVTLTDANCTFAPVPTVTNVAVSGTAGPFYCTVTAPNDGSKSYKNTACASGVPTATLETVAPAGATSACGDRTTEIVHPDILVTKTVDLPTADPFDKLTYTITVKNSGDIGLIFYSLYDQGCSDFAAVDAFVPYFLNPGATLTFTCTHVFDGKEPYTNEFCAKGWIDYKRAVSTLVGTDSESDVTKCASATTTLAQHLVTGNVFEDLNANGAKDPGEPALAGFKVYADKNNNGKLDEGEAFGLSGADGSFSVNVDLGKTTIREEAPAPWTCSFPSGCSYEVDLPKNAPPVVPSAVSARAADPVRDFGDWRPASVSGGVYNDANGNGVRDDGEGPLAGVTVFADLNGDGTLDPGDPTAITADDGSYTLGGLKPGGYVIRQLVPDGQTCTGPAGCVHSVTLTSGGSATGKDFLDQGAQAVLGARIVPGTARISGKSGCANGVFSVHVAGTRIARVVYLLDGNRVRVLYEPNSGATFAIRVDPFRLLVGRHNVVAQVTFAPSSRTHSKILRLGFQRCAVQLKAPAFTG